MAIVLLLNIIAVRILLDKLGVIDYGIYSVVSGIIIMLNSITNVLATSTQRFLSFSLGKNDIESLNKIFSLSLKLYVLIIIIVLIVSETIGLWFINQYFNIPLDRIIAANYVYQFTIVSFIFSILQLPYIASIIAHEDIGIFAIVSTFEGVLKFIIALSLSLVTCDKLIYYSIMLMLLPIITFIVYYSFSKRKYLECFYKKSNDKSLFKDIISFSGWTFLSSMAGISMNQIITILVNIFFGPIVNAYRAISLQVHSAVVSLSSIFLAAIKSPLIQSYAKGNYTYVNRIFNLSNKFVFYSLSIVIIPLLTNMSLIIKLWLNEDNVQLIYFCQLILVYSFILALNNPISLIIQATGKIKKYTLSVESLTLLCPAIIFVLFYLGFAVEYSYYMMIICIIIAHYIRLICLRKVFKVFKIRDYFLSFVLPAVVIASINIFIITLLRTQMNCNLNRLILSFIISIIINGGLAFIIGLSRQEKKIIISNLKNGFK